MGTNIVDDCWLPRQANLPGSQTTGQNELIALSTRQERLSFLNCCTVRYKGQVRKWVKTEHSNRGKILGIEDFEEGKNTWERR